MVKPLPPKGAVMPVLLVYTRGFGRPKCACKTLRIRHLAIFSGPS